MALRPSKVPGWWWVRLVNASFKGKVCLHYVEDMTKFRAPRHGPANIVLLVGDARRATVLVPGHASWPCIDVPTFTSEQSRALQTLLADAVCYVRNRSRWRVAPLPLNRLDMTAWPWYNHVAKLVVRGAGCDYAVAAATRLAQCRRSFC